MRSRSIPSSRNKLKMPPQTGLEVELLGREFFRGGLSGTARTFVMTTAHRRSARSLPVAGGWFAGTVRLFKQAHARRGRQAAKALGRDGGVS